MADNNLSIINSKVSDLLDNPDFKTLSQEEQDQLIREASTYSQRPDEKVATNKKAAEDEWEHFKKIAGTGIGLAAGGGGKQVIGPIMGALFGNKFPPNNIGEAAAQIVAPRLGGALSKIASKLPSGLARILGQGVAGGAATEGLSALTEGVNRGATAVSLQNTPKGSFANTDPTSLALGSIPPMAGEGLLSSLISRLPISKQTKFANRELGGNMSPGELKQVQLLKPEETAANLHQQFTQPYIQEAQKFQQDIQDLQSQKSDVMQQMKALDIQRANAAVEPTRAQVIAKQGLQRKLKAITEKQGTVNNKMAQNNAQIQENKQLAGQAGEGNQNKIDDINTQLAGEGSQALHTAQSDLRTATIGKEPKSDRIQASEAIREAQLENDRQRAGAIKLKAEQDAGYRSLNGEVQQGQTQNAQLQAQKTALQGQAANAKANIPVSELPLTKAELKVQQAQLKAKSSGLEAALQDMRTDAASSDPMHEAIRNLAVTSTTPTELIENLKNADPKVISAFRDHVSKTNPQGLQEFQHAMVQDFFQKAYNPSTPQNPLSNTSNLWQTEYTPSKLDAIFGTEGNKSTSLRFQDTVNDIAALGNKGNNGQLSEIGKKAGIRSMFLIPSGLAYMAYSGHTGSTMYLGTSAAVGAAGFASVAYPKIIEEAIKNPRFGRQFHEWATAAEGSAKAILTNFPRLAAWWKNNSEKVQEPQPESQNNNQLNNTNPSSLSATQ